jgi:purine-binding chemotaxis protein CheW
MSTDDLDKVDDIEPVDPIEGIDAEITHPEIHFCAFNIGDKKLTIPIETVREIIDLSETLPLPGSPDHVRGLVHLRGEVLPVVDMSKIYNTSYDANSEKKLIIADINNEYIALITDGMPDLLEDQEGELIDMESFFSNYRVG